MSVVSGQLSVVRSLQRTTDNGQVTTDKDRILAGQRFEIHYRVVSMLADNWRVV